MSAAVSALKKLDDQLAKITDAVAGIRRRIGKVETAIAEVDRSFCPRGMAVNRLDAWLDLCAARSQDLALGDLLSGEGQSGGQFFNVLPSSDLPFPFLVTCCRDQVRAVLIKRIDAAYAKRPGMTADDRRQAIEKLKGERLDIEFAEESLIRAAERAGMTIARRADADPRAVLAAEDEPRLVNAGGGKHSDLAADFDLLD